MTTALYRRYRPETFADVIGQEHVTDPLMAAVGAQRASHAYLFSGPRGCGKTTSARILARCLNCANGPSPVPCGTCDSCVELARGGSGSLDVVEIDAASHNGVDDARELRERAAFAPARDRYKIFILDEAHMVTPQGFNALLKLVEEPPPHVKFIFATTEPDKVISTIRSRTHHYPFRLVPPDRLQAYLERICTAEGVAVGSGVLPLVVRAGGGSVRDSLSVLDQLLAGAAGELDYAQAVALLGYTPETLLDDAVDALDAADGASVFRVVDRVIESGHDPRRFVEDLLQRLRDLIVIVAAGERAADVLRGVPEDQFARMTAQAQRLGLAQLSRAGDLTMSALTEMTGATSPRLQLELLCARLLLPAADEPIRGYGARIERLEKQAELGVPGGSARTAASAAASSASGPAQSGNVPSGAPDAEPADAEPVDLAPADAEPADAEPVDVASADVEPARTGVPAATGPARARPQSRPAAQEAPVVTRRSPVGPAPAKSSTAPPEQAPAAEPAAGLDTETVRRRWAEVLETLSRIRRASWTITSQNAQVVAVTDKALRLRFDTPGIASAFRNGRHADALEQALRETLGLTVKIEAVTDDGAPDQGGAGPGPGARTRARAGTLPAERPDHAALAAADWAGEGSPRPAQVREPRAGWSGSGREREHTDGDQEGSRSGGPRRPSGLSSGTPTAEPPTDEPPLAEPPVGYDVGPDDAGDVYGGEVSPAERAAAAPEAMTSTASGWPARNAQVSHVAGGNTAPGGQSDGAAAPRRDWLAEATAASSARLASPQVSRPTPADQDEWSPLDVDEQDPSDPDLDVSPLVGAQLVQRVFGATVIDEIAVDPVGSPARNGT